MKIGDPVAVIWNGYFGDGTVMIQSRVEIFNSDGFAVHVSDGIHEVPFHYALAAEGTTWCHDTPEARDALLAAYALR